MGAQLLKVLFLGDFFPPPEDVETLWCNFLNFIRPTFWKSESLAFLFFFLPTLVVRLTTQRTQVNHSHPNLRGFLALDLCS